MTMRDERYFDLRGPCGDPAAARLVDDLERLHAASLPPQHDQAIARLLRERARVSPSAAPRRRRSVRWRRPAAAGMIALAALIGGAVYASGNPPSLTDQAMVYAPGQQQVLRRYGHTINAAGHACGYTLRVTRAYADVNRVSVLYTLSGPTGRHFASEEADLATLQQAQGRNVPLKSLDAGISRDMIETTQGRYTAFNGVPMARDARTLRLRLTLLTPEMAERVGPFGVGATTAPCESYGPVGTYTRGPAVPILGGIPLLRDLFPALSNMIYTRSVTVHHPLMATFTVSVDRAFRVVAPHQTVVAGGIGLVLDHVMITRSEARVYLRRTTPGHILENVNVMLSTDGRQYSGAPLFGDSWVRSAPATRLYDFSFAGPSYAYRGEWTLTVQPIPANAFMTAPWRTLAGGPWTFHVRAS